VNIATKQRAVQCQLQLSRTKVAAGERIDVTIDTVAAKEVLIRGGEITLARTVSYRYRQVNAFGGMFTVPTHRTDIVSRLDLAGTGPLRPGVHDFQRVELAVPADELGTVSSAARNPAYQEKEEETIVASTAASAHTDFLTDQPRRFPFRITVPEARPAPSMQTPEFTVTWILRAVLDRAMHPDPHVEIEMHGTTTRRQAR
jgi:hypothetical protein